MPSKMMHRKRGSVTAVREYADMCQRQGRAPNIFEALTFGVVGGWAATLADAIDSPSHGPGHRGIAHSAEVYWWLRREYMKAREAGRIGEAVLLRAAMTHHEDDAQTPAGLPSIAAHFIRRVLPRSR